jgi:hypothetical protein
MRSRSALLARKKGANFSSTATASDGSMLLLNNVVEVFDLTDLDGRLMLGIVALERRRVGTAVVDRDLLRRTFPLDRLA